MPDQETIDQQLALLATLRRTLAHLVEQAAQFGGEVFAPPATANGIAEARQQIRRIKAFLRKNGVTVEDAPNDKAPRRRKPTHAQQTNSDQSNINTGGGNYVNSGGGDIAGRDIDKRQGTFVTFQQPASLLPSLHQLRAPVNRFVGRHTEINQLVGIFRTISTAGTVAAVSSVWGMGGIGKTELAYVVAQQLRSDFPDAQIVVELRGSGTAPVSAAQALQSVIHSFHPDAKLPNDLSQLQGIYRSAMNDKQVLIMADDAKDAAQVRPLVPPPGCALLVTSRNHFSLPGMDMETIDLGTLPPVEAEKLLLGVCPRIGPHASELAKLCAYLPLALRVSASLLRDNKSRDIAFYLEQLRVERLKHLKDPDNPDDPQASVEASLRLSYDGLDFTTHLALWQLALYPLGMPRKSIKDAILLQGDVLEITELLQRRSLLEWEAEAEEYHLHDLVRDFVIERGIRFFNEQVALARFARDLRTEQAALSYLGELYNQKGDLQAAASHYDSWAKVSGWIGDIRSTMGALQSLGLVSEKLGNNVRAVDSYERILFFARRTNNLLWQESALDALLRIYQRQGDQHKIIELNENAIALAQTSGNKKQEAEALNSLSTAFEELGDTITAITYAEKARVIWEEAGERTSAAVASARLWHFYERIEDYTRAIIFAQRWLDFMRETTPPEHKADLKDLEERLRRLIDAAAQNLPQPTPTTNSEGLS